MRDIKAPRAWYKPLGIMIQPEHVESINFDTKVIGVYLNMDGKGYHVLRLSDFELMWPLVCQIGMVRIFLKTIFAGMMMVFLYYK